MSAGSKSRLAKGVGAEVAAQSRQEKWHAAVARSTFQIKMYKTPRLRSTFGSSDVQKWHDAVARSTFATQDVQNTPAPDHVEKLHAVVARSTFATQNAKKSPLSDHFWTLGCEKFARRCGAKHIVKSKS